MNESKIADMKKNILRLMAENAELKKSLKEVTTSLYASGHHAKDSDEARIIKRAVKLYDSQQNIST
jgi:regulator of replication initiation timing